ncbi:MAG: preprotein translocase subunit YajC [Thermoleophilia bacterium]
MGGSGFLLLYLVAFVAVMYFVLIIPQRKLRAQQAATLRALSPGDEVVTAGGIYGTVTEVEDGETLLLEVAEDTEIRVAKASVTRIITDVPEGAAADTPADPPGEPPAITDGTTEQ